MGTMLVDSANSVPAPDADQPVPPICNLYTCANTKTMEEVACSYPDALITTGGGFSDYSPRPTWQNSVVSNYLQTAPPASYLQPKILMQPTVVSLMFLLLVIITLSVVTVLGKMLMVHHVLLLFGLV